LIASGAKDVVSVPFLARKKCFGLERRSIARDISLPVGMKMISALDALFVEKSVRM